MFFMQTHPQLPPFRQSDRARALANKLTNWLEATTSYVDLLEGLDRSWPNYEEPPKWHRFYQHGPVLVYDDKSILDADGKPTGIKLVIRSICYDAAVNPGDIIESRSRTHTKALPIKYMVQPHGSIRRI